LESFNNNINSIAINRYFKVLLFILLTINLKKLNETMKKILFICFALVAGHLSAQDLGAMAGDAVNPLSSPDFVNQIAGDQVKSLAKKFNFTDAQAEQASEFVGQAL